MNTGVSGMVAQSLAFFKCSGHNQWTQWPMTSHSDLDLRHNKILSSVLTNVKIFFIRQKQKDSVHISSRPCWNSAPPHVSVKSPQACKLHLSAPPICLTLFVSSLSPGLSSPPSACLSSACEQVRISPGRKWNVFTGKFGIRRPMQDFHSISR